MYRSIRSTNSIRTPTISLFDIPLCLSLCKDYESIQITTLLINLGGRADPLLTYLSTYRYLFDDDDDDDMSYSRFGDEKHGTFTANRSTNLPIQRTLCRMGERKIYSSIGACATYFTV